MLNFLITTLIVLIILGIFLFVLSKFPYIDPGIREIIKVVVMIIVILWILLSLIGFIPMPRVNYGPR